MYLTVNEIESVVLALIISGVIYGYGYIKGATRMERKWSNKNDLGD
jgi:hypothetical protein